MTEAYSRSRFKFHNPWLIKVIPIFILVFFCILGVYMIYQLTPDGMGINGDSYQYIFGADTLTAGYGIGRLDGGGQFKPLTHYPPLLSIILAGLKMTGMETRSAAQPLNALFFGLDILLVALIIKKATNSYAFALVGSGLVLISPAIIRIHTWIWSEPPFLFFELVGFFAMAIYLQKNKIAWLIVASISFGFAFLTRYPGIALIATAVIALLLSHRPSLKWKVRDTVILILISCAPMAIWMVRNYFLSGNAANRNIRWHPMTLIQRHEGIDTVLGWIFPADFITHKEKILVFVLLVIAVAAVIYWLSIYVNKGKNGGITWSNPGFRFLFSFLILIYIGFLVISISLIDPGTPLDSRILSPLQVPVIILLITFLADLWNNTRFPVQILIGVIIIYLFLMYSDTSMKIIPQLQSTGQGYANLSWKNSPVIQGVKDFPNAPIFTNQITGIYIWTGRSSWPVPWRVNQNERVARADYQEQLDFMRDRLRAGAILVLYHPEKLSEELYSIKDLTQGLTLAESFPDGEIYKYSP